MRVRRLMWRLLYLIDLAALSVPFYVFVPREVRERWSRPAGQLRNKRARDEVMSLVGDAATALVLDVGGGIAALQDTMGRRSALRVVTLDVDMEMLGRARAKLAAPLLVRADGSRLPFADETFDVVVMVHALEHIPEEIRNRLVSEIKRVSRRGVVIHGPAGEDAIDLTRRFIAALEARGLEVPRYAREHLAFPMPTPAWLTEAFPECRLQPRRNLGVELTALLTGYTPIVRWLGGYREARLAAQDDRPPFVEYTMTWQKSGSDASLATASRRERADPGLGDPEHGTPPRGVIEA